MLMICASLWVQILFTRINPEMQPPQTLQAQSSARACCSQQSYGVCEGRVELAVQATLIVSLCIHPMVMEQLFWEQAVPFPFTPSLEM